MNQECPLCLEPLAIDDVNFFPCECRYQICRFCWHRIRTDEDGRCPHCRLQYPENPVEYTPLTAEQISGMKEKGKKKSHEKKQKLMESRKNLADVRVVQKNLVFVIGLSPRLADPEVLKKQEYFGKFGKIFKVVINHHTVYSGQQGPSVSAYVTYNRTEDASKAIQAVNNAYIDGRYLKASYGTTKYCSFFLRGVQCTKSDCMYLHELGEADASFTKEDMQLGKHQEYEQITLASLPSTLNHVKEQPLLPDRVIKETKHNNFGNTRNQQSVNESALPSSANWGSKVDDVSESDTSHTEKSHSHSSRHESKGLHRTNSYPVKSTSGRRGSKCSENEEKSRDSGSRLSTPTCNSRSSSVESIRSLSSSGGSSTSGGKLSTITIATSSVTTSTTSTSSTSSRRHQHQDKVTKGGKTREKTSSHKTVVSRSMSEPLHRLQGAVIPGSKSDVSVRGTSHVVTEEEGVELNSNTFSGISPRQEEEEEEEENWDLDDIPCDDQEQQGVVKSITDEPALNVLKNFNSSGSCEFGSLGVSWQTKTTSDTVFQGDEGEGEEDDEEQGEAINGPEFMPMAWDNLKLGESSLLAAILSGTDSSPPKPEAPIDEKQRLVSASYVNYGPTTNNGVSEYQVKEVVHKPSEGTGEMLRSTLEDGFKTMFPNMQPRTTIRQGLQAGQTGSAHVTSQLYNPSVKLESKDTPTTEWPDLQTDKPSGPSKSNIAPPPGFGPQSTNSAPPTSTTYSLWGGNSGPLQGLFQQSTASSYTNSAPKPKPPPVGAISANILEASLLANQQQKNYYSLMMGGATGPTPTGKVGGNVTQAMIHQQHLQQLKQLQHQQQMYLQHQQNQLRQQQQQQQQMLKALPANMPTTPTSTGLGTSSATHHTGFTGQRPVNPYYNATAYYGGWTSQPATMGWGVAPRPTISNFNHSMTVAPVSGAGSVGNTSLVNPVQWTGQTGTCNMQQQQQHLPIGIEHGFQSMNIKQ